MTMTLSTKLSLKASARLDGAVDLGSVGGTVAVAQAVTLANGVAAGQADTVWQDRITLAASANQDIDLAGSLKDALGGAAAFARVKAIVIVADAGNTNAVIVGGASSNAWTGLLGATHTVTLRKGAAFAVFAGAADDIAYAVTGGTGDLLRVANGGAGSSVSLDIIVIGASA